MRPVKNEIKNDSVDLKNTLAKNNRISRDGVFSSEKLPLYTQIHLLIGI